LDQWRTEFRTRFGIRLDVIDRARMEEIRRQTELGANPFDHVALGLASIDFLKQERVLELLEKSSYEVIVIDEAHHCMDIGAAAEREDSQRRRLAGVLAQRSDCLILATATPHDGNDRSFASLCELLDPSLVDGRGALRGERYRQHVVRRLKPHVRDPQTGKPLFPDRQVLPRAVTSSPEAHPHFAALHRGILELVRPELTRALRTRSYSDALAFIALLKRSVSTVVACRQTLSVVATRLQGLLGEQGEHQEARRQRLSALRDFNRRLARFGAVSHEEEAERGRLEAEDLAQQLASLERETRRGSRDMARRADTVASLDDLLDLADRALRDDPKLHRLVAEIKEIRQQEPVANILVYTEYTDSQEAAIAALHAAGLGEVLSLSGADPEGDRGKLTDRFRGADGLILVSTDASAEGLNLHERCHHLIHLELPFNPNRMEQRNGRIDRYGQKLTPIVRYLYLAGTFEERILLRLISKYERQRARLTFVPNTLGLTTTRESYEQRLLAGLLEPESPLFKGHPVREIDFASPDDPPTDDPAVHDLLDEVDRAFNGFKEAAKSFAWLGDAGLNAEQEQATQASHARQEGLRHTGVELAPFVRDAVLLDRGDARTEPDGSLVLTLPPGWSHGLDDLPGYEPATRTLRLTRELGATQDSQGRSLGYLGRAHPVVHRAVERVRRLSLGGAQGMEDARVSAVKVAADRPGLLLTFLGRVTSDAGHELDQVLAVRVDSQTKPQVLTEPGQWLHLAEPSRAHPPADVWDAHFEGWGAGAREAAAHAARQAFAPLAASFAAEVEERAREGRQHVATWLVLRCREITGQDTDRLIQKDLFEQTSGGASGATWMTLPHGPERLAAFTADRAQPSTRRSQADVALKLAATRREDIERRARLREPEIVPVGVLMLLPDGTPAPEGR
jgi:hypothetical protein